MPRRTRAADPTRVDTRTRLIEVAARHFAEHGYRGASQREIQRELGMNPATAHYYFGSKEALYRGVVDAFIHDVQEERLQRLARLPRSLAGRARLLQILHDYFYPHLKLAATEAGRSYARILARVQSEPEQATIQIFSDIVEPVRRKYVKAIQSLFPRAKPEQIRRALTMGVALMAIVASWEAPAHTASDAKVHQQAKELSRYAAAGFEALLGKPVGRVFRTRTAAPRVRQRLRR